MRPSRSDSGRSTSGEAAWRARRVVGVEERRGGAVAQAELVQPRAGAHAHAEAARRDLGEQRPGVARRNMVESVRAVDDEAGEDVEPPGRALRIGRAGKARRQREPLHQRRDIDDALLQHRPVAGERDPLRVEALQPVGDARAPARQEARAHAKSLGREPQVEARRLELARLDRRCGGKGALARERLDALAGEKAGGTGAPRRRRRHV